MTAQPFPAMFRYRIRGLSAGTHPVSLQGSADPLDMAPYFGPISVSGEVEVSDRLRFLLHLRAKADLICDRCGMEYQRDVETDVEFYFIPGADAEEAEDIFNEVFSYDPHSEHEIDLTEIVRDHLLLGLPMRNLHAEDCQGVAVEAWEPEEAPNKSVLRSLYDKLRSEEMNDDTK